MFAQDGTGGPVAGWLVRPGRPMEAVRFGSERGPPRDELRAVAEAHSGIAPRAPAEVLAAARAEFPDFSRTVESWCR